MADNFLCGDLLVEFLGLGPLNSVSLAFPLFQPPFVHGLLQASGLGIIGYFLETLFVQSHLRMDCEPFCQDELAPVFVDDALRHFDLQRDGFLLQMQLLEVFEGRLQDASRHACAVSDSDLIVLEQAPENLQLGDFGQHSKVELALGQLLALDELLLHQFGSDLTDVTSANAGFEVLKLLLGEMARDGQDGQYEFDANGVQQILLFVHRIFLMPVG